MENPRAEKVAVVDEVRERLGNASASVVTEYRGLTVAQLAELRRNLAAAGGDYKVYKNTLVRLAVAGSEHETLGSLLTGPTAIAFVRGDVSAVAKALRDFSRTYPHLVIKGGLLDGAPLSTSELTTLADLPSREVLLARFAGALVAPLTQLAGLLQALPRNLAYGLSALVEQQGGVPSAIGAAEQGSDDGAEPTASAEPATVEPATEADVPADESAPTEAGSAEEAQAEPAEPAEAQAEPPAEAQAEPAEGQAE